MNSRATVETQFKTQGLFQELQDSPDFKIAQRPILETHALGQNFRFYKIGPIQDETTLLEIEI